MTDYKQLCTELVDAIDSGIPTERMYSSPLMLRVRAALAEPETDGPTDEEIMELQEAMARIETLETKVAAIEGRLDPNP